MRRDPSAPYLAALATLLGAACIFPVLSSTEWVPPVLLMIVLVTGSGILLRKVVRNGAVLLAIQTAVGVLGLTAVFASDTAHLWFFPGPASFAELGSLAAEGMDATRHFATPAPPVTGIQVLIAAGVLAVALAVDFLAVTRGTAVAAGLPLLALYCVPAAVLPQGASWLSFALVASGWLLLVAHEGRLRVHGWGRTLHPPQMSGARFREDDLELLGSTARRLGVITVIAAIAVPALLPSLPGGLLFPTSGDGAGGGRGGLGATSIDPTLTLRQNLTARSTAPVLSYHTTQTNPPPLRLVTDAVFDGETWRSQDGSGSATAPLPSTLPLPDGLGEGVALTLYTDTVKVGKLNENYLPVPFPARNISVPGSWLYAPETLDVISHGRGTAGIKYTVNYLDVEPTVAQLVAAPPAPDSIAQRYLQLPDHMNSIVAKTAKQITAKDTTEYAKAAALQDYFRNTGGFVYSTSVTEVPGDAVAGFLKTKRGYCVQFSSAMAVMARLLGIPARVAVGFLPGTRQKDGSYTVSLNDAHAWPELYFDGIGWVRFEPTPAVRTGPPPAYSVPTQSPLGDAGAAQTGAGSATAAEGSDPRAGLRIHDLSSVPTNALAPVATVSTHSRTPMKIALAAVVIVLLGLATPLAAALARRRRRRQARDAVGRAEAAWADLLERVSDLGIELAAGSTPRQCGDQLVELAALDGDDREAMDRIIRTVETARYARVAPAVDALGEDVSTVVHAVRASTTAGQRLRARVLPRSGAERLRGLSVRAGERISRLDLRIARTRRSVTRGPGRRSAEARRRRIFRSRTH